MSKEIYYFGAWMTEKGHFIRDARGHHHHDRPKGFPFHEGIFYRLANGEPHKELGYGKAQPEGHVYQTWHAGWSVFGFWNRSFDPRGNCCSGFAINDRLSYAEFLPLVKEQFGHVLDALKFDLDYQAGIQFDPTLGKDALA